MSTTYQPDSFEKKWQEYWHSHKTYATPVDSGKKKMYVLDMFPYPSGAGLHVGHPLGYIGTDIFARFHRMNNYAVLHPMGWDAFGLPAENYAIKTGVHPRITTEKNIAYFTQQLKQIGFSYDWDRQVNTTDPEYYKWTQWIFLKLFKKGLAYESSLPINWCPSCKTGLANEEVVKGNECERCGAIVEQRPIRQWVLKITEYAERLLTDLDGLNWPSSILELQRNWIGKSTGATFTLQIASKEGQATDKTIEAFTTRLDTAYGITFITLAPEHPLVDMLTLEENKKVMESYIFQAKSKSQLERTELAKEKTGVFTGSYAINPFTGEKIPVYVGDYVLGFYGTGAVIGVPAHDERDFDFAKKYSIPVKRVITKFPSLTQTEFDEIYLKSSEKEKEIFEAIKSGSIIPVGKEDEKTLAEEREAWLHFLKEKECLENSEANETAKNAYSLWNSFLKTQEGASWSGEHSELMREAFTEDGYLISSGYFNGMTSEDAREEMTIWLEQHEKGERTVNYKLRDWIFSRQRYWGEPIPLVHCAKCGIVPVPEKDLPVLLPEVEQYEPTGTGESPLAAIDEWVNTTCPNCSGPAKRETNTMPQWAGSCWYYLRFIDPKNKEYLAHPTLLKEWLPVDMYVGGAEHAVLHLLYARFWHKVLYDCGVVPTVEPFQSLKNQGMILGEDSQKMSKSKGNVINPDDTIKEFGADAFRLYEMFMGPFDAVKPWNTKGIAGVYRFLQRTWKLQDKISDVPDSKEMTTLLHQTIKKATDDIKTFNYNTVVSQFMIFMNAATDADHIHQATFETFLQLLSPFAPHITEELWHILGHKDSIHLSSWPSYDPALTVEDTIVIAVQVNGKLRGSFKANKDISQEDAIAEAKRTDSVIKFLDNTKIKKEIYVGGRLVNFVV
ncbi:MAG: leucine--tRNA ligase [Candidatus Gracilibacteria bacterium]